MDKEVILTKEELSVLKICGEELKDIEKIQKELNEKFSKEKIKKILDKLLGLKFVYQNKVYDKGDFYGLTTEIQEEFKIVRNKYYTPKNYLGERVSKKFINKAGEKIMKLPKSEIDEIWYKMGWIEESHGKNKALPDWRLEKIKNEKDWAKQSLINLFLESPQKEFVKLFS